MSTHLPESHQGHTILPGLRFIRHDGRWMIYAHSVDILQDALGADLLNAFVRCLGAVDKLCTILDMMHLNTHHANLNAREGTDSVRFNRNLHMLGMFAAGLVYECREGIQQLEDARVETRLSVHGRERWVRLRAIGELENEDALCEIRNCLAFHLGRPSTVRRGIRVLSEEHSDDRQQGPCPPFVVFEGDTSRSMDIQRPIGTNVILAGMRVRLDVPEGTADAHRAFQEADLIDALTEASRSHFRLVRLLDDVFLDCLRHAGADLSELDPIEGEEEDS